MTKTRSLIYGSVAALLSTLLALVIAEFAVVWLLPSPAEAAAQRAGLQWDRRDRLDVILDQRVQDPHWFPAVPAYTYVERPLHINGRRVIPLGGVANARVVGCNENGYFSTFATDEFGFNNPPGALAAGGRHIYFVGDSFTQGDCLRQGEAIVDRVRLHRPGTINFGSGGNGPLFQLAAIREYVATADRPVVVWMYYEGNDLEDVHRDRVEPLLAGYLDPRFSQGLMAAQAQINSTVRTMVEDRMNERLRGRPLVLPRLRMLAWQARQNLSGNAGEENAQGAKPFGSQETLELFLEILARARNDVSSRGGTLLMVYLPEYYRYAGPRLSWGAAQREAVLAGAQSLGIPVIDVEEAFRRQADPMDLFPFRWPGHYNAAGARIAADTIIGALPPTP